MSSSQSCSGNETDYQYDYHLSHVIKTEQLYESVSRPAAACVYSIGGVSDLELQLVLEHVALQLIFKL